MTPDFVRRHAPKLALPPREQDTTAGLEPNHPRDDSGMPLPYLQWGNEPRQYFDGLRGRLPEEPALAGGLDMQDTPQPTPAAPNLELRGTQEPPSQSYRPENILEGNRMGPRAVVPIPPDTGPPQHGARVTVPIPPDTNVNSRIVNGIRSGSINPVEPSLSDAMNNPEGATLADLIDSFGFAIPWATRMHDVFGNRQSDNLRGRSRDDSTSIIAPEPEGTVLPLSQRMGAIQDYPDFSTPQGLTEFNRRMGINLGAQVRSQAQQDSLRRRGATSARRSWHTTGRAGDLRPADIGGLRGRQNIPTVRRMLIEAGYPADMDIVWEDGVTHGTGPHYHIEPPNRYNYLLNEQ